jgi:hypothetical protein
LSYHRALRSDDMIHHLTMSFIFHDFLAGIV